jgi:hypothetical protein
MYQTTINFEYKKRGTALSRSTIWVNVLPGQLEGIAI